jgi:hypothetical protein
MKYLALFLALYLIPITTFAGVNTHSVTLNSATPDYAKRMSPSGLPSGSNARTIIVYVKTTATGEIYFLGYGSDTTAGQFDLTTDNASGGILSIRQNGGNRRFLAPGITDGNWHKIAIVYPGGVNINSATVDAYMDTTSAQLSDSSAGSGVTNTVFGCIQIGADSGGGCTSPSVFFNGSVDDVQVWDKALSTAEIDAAWDGCTLSDSASNLVGRWRLDNGWSDSTSNANDLTPAGTPSFTSDTAYSCGTPESTKVPFLQLIGNVIIQGVTTLKANN